MKPVINGLALTAAAVMAAIGLASPAQANAPGYVKQGVYGWADQCAGVGYTGQANQLWSNYYCTTIIPSRWSGPGHYELWVS
ncbi:hypothetical protein OG792_20655 [Micromonospora sp. NBC_01699]|uniref:hypothetical protein n=1 Tax=Micromonospora sp. NBC_01699 TaxID=2975984 RepID=UPI002E2930EF|nr:hypothetical protein [Micromonospora sp. NBC_01699]